MIRKKGQMEGAGGAAALIGIITGMIILYILFLPPADRQALLEGNESSSSVNGDEDSDNISVLLSEKPGRLDYLKVSEYDHDIQEFVLFSSTEAAILESVDSIYIKRTLFSKIFTNLSFGVIDPENTKNLLLSFRAPVRRGRLIIYLNGNLIADRVIRNENPPPITLPNRFIREENTIEFIVSGPGALFWVTNEFNLESVMITADVTDVAGLESKQYFFITEEEKKNLDKVKLKFVPDCEISKVGKLEIFLNNQNIYSLIPDCGILNTIIIDPSRILEGENKLIFETDKGRYGIYNAELVTELKDMVYPTYYFELTKEGYEDIEDDKKDINLTIVFSNDKDLKGASIKVNNHQFGIDTRDLRFTKSLDSYVREGNNALEFDELKTKLDIIELKVKLIDK